MVGEGRRGRKREEGVVERLCRGQKSLVTVCGGEERGVGGNEMGHVEGH